MKILKIYFIVATFMLIAAIGTGVYVWYTYQTLTQAIERDAQKTVSPDVPAEIPETNFSNEGSVSTVSETSNVAITPPPITIDATQLTDAQREILKSFGYSGDSITIPKTTVSCAEDALGNDRFAQILNGAAPTPLEALRVMPCMKQ